LQAALTNARPEVAPYPFANRVLQPGIIACFKPQFLLHSVSARSGVVLETLRSASYHLLGVLRVYTGVPGKPADRARPFTPPIGSTVLDLAREIHRDLEHSIRSVRVWGTGVFDGQRVKRDHELNDGDLVELNGS